MKYEKPTLFVLRPDSAEGHTGNCSMGTLATVDCRQCNTAGSYCSTGSSANGICVPGQAAFTACNKGTGGAI